jgi:hypothetical protein
MNITDEWLFAEWVGQTFMFANPPINDGRIMAFLIALPPDFKRSVIWR